MAYIQLKTSNFYYNLTQIAKKTQDINKVAIVLKDNAYGHGLEEMATLASEFGISEAVVRNVSEAQKISTLFSNILILGAKGFFHKQYSFAINCLADIDKAQKHTRVELKVDTGMHRNGIAMEELEEALEKIKSKELHLIGIMTHYRSADELSSELFWQQKNFAKIKTKIKALGYKNIRFHSHNSATILRVKHFDEDLVRIGIGAFGYNELHKIFDKISLKPVLAIYAQKIATRVLKKGQRLGYGGDFIAPREMRISSYDLGYGDGWRRGEYITAENLPILGRVSMDMIVLESQKEEVCIMNNAQISAKFFNTISYEMTTGLTSTLKKVIEEE